MVRARRLVVAGVVLGCVLSGSAGLAGCAGSDGCGSGGDSTTGVVEDLFAKIPDASTEDDVCRFFPEGFGDEGLAWVKKAQPALAAAGGGSVTVAENKAGQTGAEHAVVVSVGGRPFATVSVLEQTGSFHVAPSSSTILPRS